MLADAGMVLCRTCAGPVSCKAVRCACAAAAGLFANNDYALPGANRWRGEERTPGPGPAGAALY